MFEYFTSFPMLRCLRSVAVPALLTSAMLAAFSAAAQSGGPSQTPLITRVAAQVKPNMMVTVDDSGSMGFDYMPEGVVNFGTASAPILIAMPQSTVTSDLLGEPMIWSGGQTVSTAPAIQGDKTYLTQRMLRSPQTNTVYYNPETTYVPWKKADGSRYPIASYNAAVYDPNGLVSGSVDLGKVVSAKAGGLTAWVTSLVNSGGFTKATLDSTSTFSEDPALYYVLTGSDPNSVASYTEYDLNGSATTFPKGSLRTDCVSKPRVCTLAEERQNFANWFVYFRSRNLMAKAGLSESLPTAINLVRLGWGSINHSGVIQTPITDVTTSTLLDPILTNIQKFVPNNSTPLRTALKSVGEYFRKTGSDSPWLDTLGQSNSPAAACRRSYNILTTDGYYNDTYTSSGNVDGANGGADGVAGRTKSNPADDPLGVSPNNYVASRPYSDSQSNMLADVAEYYYVNDLQPGIPNKVAPIVVDTSDKSAYPAGTTWQNDIAYWQHLQQFTVGLGVKGTMDPNRTLSDGTANPNYSLPSLMDKSQYYTVTTTKPDGSVVTTKVTGTGLGSWNNDHIDDLWHAALDSHGQYFSVRNSQELARALGDVINQAAGASQGQAGAVASTTQISTSTLAYIPTYAPSAWTGNLLAKNVDQTTGKPTTTVWEATNQGLVPTFDKRNSWTLASDGSGGQAFRWASGGLDTANQTLVNIGTQTFFSTTGSEALLNYIKGDDSNEGASGLYRSRIRKNDDPKSATTLPDYVDSPPLLVKDFVNAGYGPMACGGVAYSDYFTGTKSARKTGTIFVGGNGGMLNAFDSQTGKELFDYVPRSGLQNLALLAYKGYGSASYPHKFFVDGPLVESDACIVNKNSGGKSAWTNLVVGALGAGGSGVFVLDTTTVGSSSPHFDATMPLREWSGVSDNDIGDIFSNPQVAMIKGGGWKVFTGNGVYSKNGKAALLVLDLATGTADRVYLGTGLNTGAMGAQLVYDGNHQAIGAYVGDVKGNLWRVEFRGATSKDWSVGYGGQPLFSATGPTAVPQAITATPILTTNAAAQQVVLFGTGKLYDTADPDDTSVQTTYGVVDKFPMDQKSSGATLTRANLNVQAVTDVKPVTAIDGTVSYYYTVAPQGAGTSTSGWLMDLVYTSKSPNIDPGTRVIYPEFAVQTAVFVNAVTPAGVPAECDTALGKGYFFVLDSSSGPQSTVPTWDTNGDGVFDSGDATGAGVGTSAGGTATQLYKDNDPQDGIFAINSGDGHKWRPPPPLLTKCTAHCVVADRVWRQILTPPTP